MVQGHDTSPLHGTKIQKILIPNQYAANQAAKNLIRDFELDGCLVGRTYRCTRWTFPPFFGTPR